MPVSNTTDHAWWSDRRYLAFLVMLSAAPLIWPPLPPLIDALGHLSRYHIQTTLAHSPALRRYFSFDWQLIGNLGVDLLIVPMSWMIGLEPAFKAIVLMIPVLTAAGLMLVARETHGRATPFVAFALPLAYAYPFQFGFLNSCLANALALVAFAGWIALGKAEHTWSRSALFVPIGLLLWLCHVVGWAELGVMVAAYEWARGLKRSEQWWRAALGAILATAPLWPPLAMMLLWRSGGAAGETTGWFNLSDKALWLTDVFRERWKVFDRAALSVVATVIVSGLIFYRRIGWAKEVGWVAFAFALAFLLVPYTLFGSDLADMRLAPIVVAIALLALRTPASPRWANAFAAIGLMFFLVRTAVVTSDFADYAHGYSDQLVALNRIPHGARVLVISAWRCKDEWASDRMEHLGGMAIVRRDAFTNDQWALKGAQLLSIHHPAARAYQQDPSEFIPPWLCQGMSAPIDARTFPNFPHSAFDYLWIINLADADRVRQPDLVRIWSRSDGALYQIVRAKSASDHRIP